MPLTKEDVHALIQRHGSVIIIGTCFMSMFGKAGWIDTISLDLMIDATIDPVIVIKRMRSSFF